MTCNTVVTFSAAACVLLGSAAFAGSHQGHGMNGSHGHMMEMMHRMHRQMHEDDSGDMHHGMHDRGRGQMKGMMHGSMRRMLDADGDGKVTPEEAGTQLQDLLKRFDADASGTLSIAEYEALHSAMIREKMVDRFQHLDADGDGQITPDEMNAPANRMMRMRRMQMNMNAGDAGSESGADTMDSDNATQQN